MPKELIRKRGRKHKKADKENDFEPKREEPVEPEVDEAALAGPSSLPDGAGGPGAIDPSAPFGYVDPDIKAYFRSVDEKLREWEDIGLAPGEGGESELEDRTTFLHSSLAELRSLELTLATDSDCALIMERLLFSMGDWGRRVLADSFAGSWSTLLQHRFGSHVCQTLFSLAAEVIDRESRGIFPKQHIQQQEELKADSSVGVLRTMTQLIVDLCQEILPTLAPLLTSPHASPPIRLLLILLSPHKPMPSATDAGAQKLIRSKRSIKYRKSNHAGKMQSIFGANGAAEEDGAANGKKSAEGGRKVPREMQVARSEIRESLHARLSGTEWRALGVEDVGGPVAQILLEIEADDGAGARPNSILDHLTSGLVTHVASGETPLSEDYVPSLLRDTTGSHLLEAILSFAPQAVFEALWQVYFVGKLGKMASHPIASFVVAVGVKRLDAEGVRGVLAELKAVGVSTLARTSRLSVLKALVDWSTQHGQLASEVVQTVCDAFELETAADRKLLVPCCLTLNVIKMYRKALAAENGAEVEDEPAEEEEAEPEAHGWKPRQPKAQRKPLEPNMQGSLLLQAMVDLPAPANEAVFESLTSLPVKSLLELAHNPISSHVIDAALRSKTASFKSRKRLLNAFNGQIYQLVDDKFGSRVGDTIWEVADGFTKEKLARSLIPDAIKLSESQYGRFFARKLNLQLLDRRPDEWRQAQLGVVHHFAHEKAGASAGAGGPARPGPGVSSADDKKRKRALTAQADPVEAETAVIDELFEPVLDKKKRKKTRDA